MFLTQTITPFDHQDLLPECVLELMEQCSEAIKSFFRRLHSPGGQTNRPATAAAIAAANASNKADDAPSIKRRVVVEPPPRLTKDSSEPEVKPHSRAFYVPPPPLSSPAEAGLSL